MASAAASRTSSAKILSNSFWYGLEQVMEIVVFLGTSIVVARALGPDKLGYFSYINLFVGVITGAGGSGLAMATRKYMSEYFAQDRVGLAHSVYRFTWRYQLVAAFVISAIGVLGVWFFAEPQFRLMSAILVASILPGVMSWVPAQANAAFEDMSPNTISALGYMFSYAVIVVLTLWFHWDLVGIASASLIGRVVEVVMRTIPLSAKLRKLPYEPLPHDVKSRIGRYCLESIGIQLVLSIVWNRSELIFLRKFSTLEQMGFYSVAAGLTSKLLILPRTFGGATGITLMVESSRDPGRVDGIVKNASRYLLLAAIPVHLGAAAITAQAIRVAYGHRYAGAVPAMVIACLLSLPLAFQDIPDTLLRAADRQRQIIGWLVVTAVVNIALDWMLIPRYAAAGAAWGNGISQAFGVCAMWIQAQRAFPFRLPKAIALRLLVAGGVMAMAASAITHVLPGAVGLVLAIGCAVPLYVVLVKALHGLESSDRVRLLPLANRLPGPLRRVFDATITFVTPAAPAAPSL